jgi:2-polyprenyl-3-methyl-5-hydroxy-6-metoxy-1,4-benzoquinol methylase
MRGVDAIPPSSGPDMEVQSRCDKYTTRNPIARLLLRRFFADIGRLLGCHPFDRVVEIGCGEGLLLHHLRPQLEGKDVFAVDIDARDVRTAVGQSGFARYTIASAYALPFRDEEFDLAICCEVLEHLEQPELALREICRVSAGCAVLSVPNEPLWRLLNLARGAYVRDLGNTPGHINHWGPRAFRAMVSRHFRVVETVRPVPWTGLLCTKR